eukprot:5885322-Pyramimonas_sp.AAC.1
MATEGTGTGSERRGAGRPKTQESPQTHLTECLVFQAMVHRAGPPRRRRRRRRRKDPMGPQERHPI